MRKTGKIFLFFLCGFFSGNAFANTSKINPTSEYNHNLSKIMNEIEHSIISEIKPSENVSALNPLFTMPFLKHYLTNEKIRLTKQQIEWESKNLGLKIRSQFLYNENINFINPTLIPYKWDIFIGLDWDILRGGLLENRMKEKDLKETLKSENLLHWLGIKGENNPVLIMSVTYLFNKSLIHYLEKDRQFLLFYYKIMKELYFTHYVTIESVQKVQDLLEKTKMRLDEYKPYDESVPETVKNKIKDFNAVSLPIPKIRLKKIYKAIENPVLKKTIIANQKAAVPEFYDIHVTPFVGFYTGATRIGGSNTNSYSFGISVSIPIPLRTRQNNKIVETEKKLVALNYENGIRTTINNIRTSYSDYIHSMDSILNLLFIKQEMLALLENNVIKYKFKAPGFSPLDTFSNYADLLDTEIKILQTKKLIYLSLIDIQKYIPDPSITQFVSSMNLEKKVPVEAKEKPGKRSIYIWSDEFNNIKNEKLFWLMEIKNIKTALISIGQKTNKEKLKKFLNLIKGSGIKTEALIGTRHIPSNQNLNTIMNEVSKYNFFGVHLDIEPYTLPDWKEKIGYYMSLYIKMLKEIKQYPWMKDKILSVSIPIFYSENVLKSIFPLVDRVYVMAYGTKNPQTVARQTEKERAIDKNKTGIALSVKNFNNSLEMENFIETLHKITGCNFFAFHSLKDFLKISQENL